MTTTKGVKRGKLAECPGPSSRCRESCPLGLTVTSSGLGDLRSCGRTGAGLGLICSIWFVCGSRLLASPHQKTAESPAGWSPCQSSGGRGEHPPLQQALSLQKIRCPAGPLALAQSRWSWPPGAPWGCSRAPGHGHPVPPPLQFFFKGGPHRPPGFTYIAAFRVLSRLKPEPRHLHSNTSPFTWS